MSVLANRVCTFSKTSVDNPRITSDVGPNSVGLASGKVAELVKRFKHVYEILDGFRYKMGAYPQDFARDERSAYAIQSTRARSISFLPPEGISIASGVAPASAYFAGNALRLPFGGIST